MKGAPLVCVFCVLCRLSPSPRRLTSFPSHFILSSLCVYACACVCTCAVCVSMCVRVYVCTGVCVSQLWTQVLPVKLLSPLKHFPASAVHQDRGTAVPEGSVRTWLSKPERVRCVHWANVPPYPNHLSLFFTLKCF